MSKNQKHRLAQIQIPILNHPHGRQTCSMLRALDIKRQGRGFIVDGVLHWGWVTDVNMGYYGPTRMEWHGRQSGEYGPIVMQGEQGK